jgi:hypothetical protein
MKTDTPLLSNLNPNTPSEFRSPVKCLSSLFALNIALVEKIEGVSSLERTSFSGRLEFVRGRSLRLGIRRRAVLAGGLAD